VEGSLVNFCLSQFDREERTRDSFGSRDWASRRGVACILNVTLLIFEISLFTMNTYLEMDVQNIRVEFCIFYQEATHERVRDELAPLRCKKCKKFDEQIALGLLKTVKVPSALSGRDAFFSDDFMLVVSARAQAILQNLGFDNDFYPIGEDRLFYAVYPKREIKVGQVEKIYTPIEPGREGELFQVRSKACAICGRYKSITCNLKNLQPPDNLDSFAVRLERPESVSYLWFIDSVIGETLRACSLKGLRLNRYGVRNAGN
jgi:hypothetical protein